VNIIEPRVTKHQALLFLNFWKMCYNTVMLALQKQPVYTGRSKYISKVMTLPNGEEALVVFELVERNGQIVAKAIYAESITACKKPENTTNVLLEVASPAEFIPFSYFSPEVLQSFLKDLSFITSQPTRAPAYI